MSELEHIATKHHTFTNVFFIKLFLFIVGQLPHILYSWIVLLFTNIACSYFAGEEVA